jgi:undecaprenyl diphosphate synthase
VPFPAALLAGVQRMLAERLMQDAPAEDEKSVDLGRYGIEALEGSPVFLGKGRKRVLADRIEIQAGVLRIEGHRAGSNSVREVVEASARLGIKVLTLYAFSKENWKRPHREVSELWSLLRDYLKKEARVLMENDLRLLVIGQKEGIPRIVLKELERVEGETAGNGRMTVVLALNYGGRSEIIDAVKRIVRERSVDPDTLTEESFSAHLYTASLPDPDLLIRTSGELRVSNFLLWQIAYAEMWMTPVLWPDFRKKHLLQALVEYQQRERRFGDIRPR